MSFACHGILIAIFLFTIYSSWSKGFIKSITGLIKGGVSALVAYAFTPSLGTILNERFIRNPLTDGIFETLRSLAFDTNTDLYNLDRLATDLPAPLVSILERFNINIRDFSLGTEGLTAVSEDIVYECSSAIAGPTASVLSSVLAFAIIFIAVFLALSLITALLDLIFRLPVLNSVNKLLGILLGAAEAILLVSIASILLSTLVTALGSIEPDLFGPDLIEHTVICKFLAEHNPLWKIYDVLV